MSAMRKLTSKPRMLPESEVSYDWYTESDSESSSRVRETRYPTEAMASANATSKAAKVPGKKAKAETSAKAASTKKAKAEAETSAKAASAKAASAKVASAKKAKAKKAKAEEEPASRRTSVTSAEEGPDTAGKSPSPVRELTEAAGFKLLLGGAEKRRGSGVLVLACFSAGWCRPCVMFAPKLEQMARRYSRVAFVKLDVEKLPDVAIEYDVKAVPTFVLFKNGSQVGSVVAASQPKIELLLANNGVVPASSDTAAPSVIEDTSTDSSNTDE